MFPEWMAESAAKAILFWGGCLCLITWRVKKIARNFDQNGEIKGAAQKAAAKGVASMIGRWLR